MLYVAPDGNYGEAEYLVVVDDSDFDDHFVGYLDECSDYLRPSFAKWFEDNQHDFAPSPSIEWACLECDEWFESEN